MCSKGWDYRCAVAKGKKCQCQCRGLCHGRAQGKSAALVLTLRRMGELPNSEGHGYVQTSLPEG